jgi:hypothetical protein
MPPGEASRRAGLCVYMSTYIGIYIYLPCAAMAATLCIKNQDLTKNPHAQNEESLKCISKLLSQGTLRSPSIIIKRVLCDF